MNILFYAPFYQRSRDTESLMLEFVKKGNAVFLLTLFENGPIVEFLKNKDVKVYCLTKQKYKNNLLNIFYHCYKLILFCKSHKVDILFSHLEFTNFIAVLSQYFIKSKVVINRHHVDELHLIGEYKTFSYWITYHLAKRIIVVSNRAKKFMTDMEKINPDTIDVVPLLYDFNLYDPIDKDKVNYIKKYYKADVLLILACRLVKDKRPELSVQLIKNLISQNVKAKLIILGEGEMYDELMQMIEELSLQENVFLLGRKTDVLNYLSACDFLVHPSVLDSSSVVIKEAGIVGLAPIVCKEVGDVNDYLENGINAYLVHKDTFVEEGCRVIKNVSNEAKKAVGENLKNSVLKRFNINTNFIYYENLIK